MTCRFLDNLTLAKLIAPMTEAEFRAHYWEKKPLCIRRSDPGYYDDLLTLDDFDRAISNTPSNFKTAGGKNNVVFRCESEEAAHPGERIVADLSERATLILDQLDKREPKVRLLCRMLEQQLGHRFRAKVYLTPPQGQGFIPHWDGDDVFNLQLLGSKHWKIEKLRRKFPGRTEHMGDEAREFVGEVDSFTLNQGDMLYNPRGFVHAAECGSETSLHIRLGLKPYTWADLLQATIQAAVQDDEHLRHALPPGFLASDGKDLVKGAMAALSNITNEAYLSAVVDRFGDELVTTFPLDISGQVIARYQVTGLSGEDVVGPRLGIVYRMHSDEESVRLNFGGRTITFPSFFREPLVFTLKTPAYAVRDIEGDLEDEEKIVFVERLIQEGLVVRK